MTDPARPVALKAVMPLALFVLLSTVVGRSFTALSPGAYDSMLFAYVGDQWRQGAILYRDIWDNKPPGIFALLALVFSVFPGSFLAVAVVEGAFVAGCVAAVYGIMRELRSPWYATATATVVAAAAGNLRYLNSNGILTEIYLILPAALSMYFFIRSIRSDRLALMIAAGFCSGLASLFKAPGLAPYLAQACLLAVLLTLGRERLSTVGRYLTANTFGLLLAWVVPVAYFLRYDSAGELMNASFLFNVGYGISGQPALHTAFLNLAETLAPLAVAAIAALVLCAYAVLYAVEHLRHSQPASRSVPDDLAPWLWLILLWVLFDTAGAIAGGWNYTHYYMSMVPSLAVSTGVACWLMLDGDPIRRPTLVARGAVIALLVGPFLFQQMSDVKEMERTVRFGPPPDYAQGSVRFLNSVRSPNDTLFSWDYLPAVFYRTEMKSPLRFMSGSYLNKNRASQQLLHQEVFEGLRREMPTFLMDSAADPARRVERSPLYAEFYAFAARNYDLVYTDHEYGVNVYKRRSQPAGL